MFKKLIFAIIRFITITIICFVALSIVPPVKKPFLCNDPFLSYPIKKQTIGTLGSYSIALSVIFFIFVAEIISNFSDTTNYIFKPSLRNTAFLYAKYLTNLALGQIFMTVAKLSTGVHRPIFFEACQPDTLENCTSGTYVYKFTCLNSGTTALESVMSFYSTHAQMIAFPGFFMIFYLHHRIKSHKFTVNLINVLILCIIFFICVSRVTDFRHWVSDVVVGAIIGFLLALYTWFVQCKNYNFKQKDDIKNLVAA